MASTSSTLPMRVTRTARGTHVVHVRGFSRLQEQQCGVGCFVHLPPFAVAGLDWAIRYSPGSDDGEGRQVYKAPTTATTTRTAKWASSSSYRLRLYCNN
jgi:hypothetical protein